MADQTYWYKESGLDPNNKEHKKMIDDVYKTHDAYDKAKEETARLKDELKRDDFFSILRSGAAQERLQKEYEAALRTEEEKRLDVRIAESTVYQESCNVKIQNLEKEIKGCDAQISDWKPGVEAKTKQIEELKAQMAKMTNNIELTKAKIELGKLEERLAYNQEKLDYYTNKKAELQDQVKEATHYKNLHGSKIDLYQAQKDIDKQLYHVEQMQTSLEAAEERMNDAKERLDRVKDNGFWNITGSNIRTQAEIEYNYAKTVYETQKRNYDKQFKILEDKETKLITAADKYNKYHQGDMSAFINSYMKQVDKLQPADWERTNHVQSIFDKFKEIFDKIKNPEHKENEIDLSSITEGIKQGVGNVIEAIKDKDIDIFQLTPEQDAQQHNDIDRDTSGWGHKSQNNDIDLDVSGWGQKVQDFDKDEKIFERE